MSSTAEPRPAIKSLPWIGWMFYILGLLSLFGTFELNRGFMIYGPVFGVALLVGLFATLRRVNAPSVVLMLAAAVTPGSAYLLLVEHKASAAAQAEKNALDKRMQFNASAKAHALTIRIEAYLEDIGSPPPNLQALLEQPPGVRTWLGPYAKPDDILDPRGSPFLYEIVEGRAKVSSSNFEIEPL